MFDERAQQSMVRGTGVVLVLVMLCITYFCITENGLPLTPFGPPLHSFVFGGDSSTSTRAAPPRYAHAQPTGVLVHTPTISAKLINQVLTQAGSTAAGTGAALYQDGVTYGIDPVYALAFFQHESRFGTLGWAVVNHSIGNVRCYDAHCRGGYEWYPSWQASYLAWYALIRHVYIDTWHLSTLARILPVYAPPRDHNNVAAYVQAVQSSVRTWQRQSASL